MKTILLIEDNDQNRYLEAFLLERRGYRVLQAENGLSGIERARSDVPDLILLDIQLPVLDGYGVAANLRTIEGIRDIPIIAVTSHAMVGDREKALAAGCRGYIEKPIDPDTFVDQVECFLTGRPFATE
jgi:two-component system cell cycle response regulator DivK